MKPTPQDIIKAVNHFVGFEVRFDTGKRVHCEPRQIMQYLIHNVIGLKPPQISVIFNCDRSNVYNGIKKVDTLIKYKNKQVQYRSLFEQFGIEIIDYGFDIKMNDGN